jgi:hypothetical protein
MYYLYKKYKVKKQREARAAAEQETADAGVAPPPIEVTADKEGGEFIQQPAPTKALPPIEPEENPAEKKARRVYRWKLVLCLFPSAFLAAIDTTIVATSLTTISSHFSKFSYYLSLTVY